MRSHTPIALLAIIALAASVPITPAAPEYQRLVERMRYEGMAEHDISERLTLPASNDLDEISFQPLYSQVSTGFHSLFRSHLEDEERDLSGDIPPGSLEAPQMLPRAAAPTTLFDSIRAVLRGQDAKRREFGYEGKEGELRRPEGMRHWETVQ